MNERKPSTTGQWCIVIAHDSDSGWVPESIHSPRGLRPVQYSTLGDPRTLLQKALHRAGQFAPSSQIIVTAIEDHREYWQPAFWSIRPEHRIIGDSRLTAPLTTAAALLLVAAKSPMNIVTILPAKCHISHECALSRSLRAARESLPSTPEGVVTLGMIDVQEGIDEDYIVPARASAGSLWVAQGMARRPVPWIARHLRENGAMAASGIFVGYAGVFAAHFKKHWPSLTAKLTRTIERADGSGTECRVPVAPRDEISSAALRSLGWCAPAFPQRVLRVEHAGWSGLRSARAIARICALTEWRKVPVDPSHGEIVVLSNAVVRANQ